MTDVLIAAEVTLLVWRLVYGPSTIAFGQMVIRFNTLYTPRLVLLVTIAARAWATWKPSVSLNSSAFPSMQWIRLAAIAVGVCVITLSPVLIGAALRLMTGRLPSQDTFWRSTPRGVDLLSYFVPNHNHSWFEEQTRYWLMPPCGDAFPEFGASFSLTALIIIAICAKRGVLPRLWIAFTSFCALLSLGPFVHVAGVNTQLLAPWGLLRFVPGIGMVRSPGRFAIVAVLGLSVLCGFALQSLVKDRRQATVGQNTCSDRCPPGSGADADSKVSLLRRSTGRLPDDRLRRR